VSAVVDTSLPGENGYRLYARAGLIESGIITDYAIFRDNSGAHYAELACPRFKKKRK
jgi:hypothetical protein